MLWALPVAAQTIPPTFGMTAKNFLLIGLRGVAMDTKRLND